MKNSTTRTQLVMVQGGLGGVGKTVTMVAIADYLQTKGLKFACADCDMENQGKLRSFGHWFNGKTAQLDLRDTGDCDKLLEGSANAGSPFVLADLPSNSSGDIVKYWKDIVTREVLNELNLSILSVGVVTTARGSAESVCQWIDALGSNVQYLIALNRLSFEFTPAPKEKAFSHWFTLGAKYPHIDIPHLRSQEMESMTELGLLPSKALKSSQLLILPRQRIKHWRDAIHSQLEALNIFASPTAVAAETANA
jgi:CobQ/CobB/MinD/ParA nucleotide binding domain